MSFLKLNFLLKNESFFYFLGVLFILSFSTLAAQNEIEVEVKKLYSPKPEVRNEAVQALIKIGPDVGFPLIEVIRKAEITLKGNLETTKAAISILEEIKDTQSLLDSLAAKQAVGRNGGRNFFVTKRSYRPLVAEALYRIGKETHPFLLEYLSSDDPKIGEWTAKTIAKFGPVMIPKLANIVVPNDKRASRAIESLAYIGKDSLPVLLERFNTFHETRMQISFLDGFGIIGPEASEAFPFIVDLLIDQESLLEENPTSEDLIDLVKKAIETLGKIGKLSKESLSLLVKLADSSNSTIRFYTIEAIGNMGEKEIVIPVLRKATKDKEWDIRAKALKALANYGKDAAIAMPELIASLADQEEVSRRAAETLSELGPLAEPALSALINAVQNRGGDTQEISLWAIGKIGPKAKQAVPAVIVVLQNKKHPGNVRCLAVIALGEIGDKEAIPALMELSTEENEELKKLAIDAIQKINKN